MLRDGQVRRIAMEWSHGQPNSALYALFRTGVVEVERLNAEIGELRVILLRVEWAGVTGASKAERDVIALARWVAECGYEGARPVDRDSWGAANLDYSPPARRDFD